MPDREYRRIARPRARHKTVFSTLAIRSSIWIGEDHLLNIDSARYSEDYKRFYFRDIQAITIRTTQRRRVWNFVLGLLLMIWLGTVSSTLVNTLENPAIALYAAGPFLLAIALLLNNVMGPTCATYIRTAVQTEELPSLNRVRRARKFLDFVRPLIVAAQQQQEPLQQQEHEEPAAPVQPTVKSSEVAAP